MKRKLHVIKIGGNIIDDQKRLAEFLRKFADISEAKILVHGGGKSATELANALGIHQTIIEGRRITNAATLDVIVMVYAGLINKSIVAKLQAFQCNATGFCGADGNLIQSKKREHPEIDYGFVGDILSDGIDTSTIELCLNNGLIPVISAVTHDGNGQLLNTNADAIASGIAVSMNTYNDVNLTYCFDKKGVLTDFENESSYLPEMSMKDYINLSSKGIIAKGMIPKLDNAFKALEHGVKKVNICSADEILGGTLLKCE